jgi:hypothetical protein
MKRGDGFDTHHRRTPPAQQKAQELDKGRPGHTVFVHVPLDLGNLSLNGGSSVAPSVFEQTSERACLGAYKAQH